VENGKQFQVSKASVTVMAIDPMIPLTCTDYFIVPHYHYVLSKAGAIEVTKTFWNKKENKRGVW